MTINSTVRISAIMALLVVPGTIGFAAQAEAGMAANAYCARTQCGTSQGYIPGSVLGKACMSSCYSNLPPSVKAADKKEAVDRAKAKAREKLKAKLLAKAKAAARAKSKPNAGKWAKAKGLPRVARGPKAKRGRTYRRKSFPRRNIRVSRRRHTYGSPRFHQPRHQFRTPQFRRSMPVMRHSPVIGPHRVVRCEC